METFAAFAAFVVAAGVAAQKSLETYKLGLETAKLRIEIEQLKAQINPSKLVTSLTDEERIKYGRPLSELKTSRSLWLSVLLILSSAGVFFMSHQRPPTNNELLASKNDEIDELRVELEFERQSKKQVSYDLEQAWSRASRLNGFYADLRLGSAQLGQPVVGVIVVTNIDLLNAKAARAVVDIHELPRTLRDNPEVRRLLIDINDTARQVIAQLQKQNDPKLVQLRSTLIELNQDIKIWLEPA